MTDETVEAAHIDQCQCGSCHSDWLDPRCVELRHDLHAVIAAAEARKDIYMEQAESIARERDTLKAERDHAKEKLLIADEAYLQAEADIEKAEQRVLVLEEALAEHACVEKPEEGFTKERYPKHSCWAALTPPPAEGGS